MDFNKPLSYEDVTTLRSGEVVMLIAGNKETCCTVIKVARDGFTDLQGWWVADPEKWRDCPEQHGLINHFLGRMPPDELRPCYTVYLRTKDGKRLKRQLTGPVDMQVWRR